MTYCSETSPGPAELKLKFFINWQMRALLTPSAFHLNCDDMNVHGGVRWARALRGESWDDTRQRQAMSYSVFSSDWFLVLIPSRGGAVSGGGLDGCSLT
jgi:hypothetical protein